MRQGMWIVTRIVVSLALLASMSACDKMVDSSRSAATVTGKAYNDSVTFWSDAFTYHAPAKPNLAQTRYCYKNMDDIVCYDSVQPTLTSRLVGFQDGEVVSWVQQGGGSLGASGAPPVAFQQANSSPVNSTEIISVKTPMEHDAGATSYHRTGEIQTIDLPPRGL